MSRNDDDAPLVSAPDAPPPLRVADISDKASIEKDFRSVRADGFLVRFLYWYRHPWFRLFIATILIFLNFVIFSEDPIAHSYSECSLPVIGDAVGLVFLFYPVHKPHFMLVKILAWVLGIPLGIVAGYLLHRYVLGHHRVLNLKMFRGSKGVVLVSFLMTLVTLFLIAKLYNAIVSFDDDMLDFLITGRLGIPNKTFATVAATGTLLGDWITVLMVVDMMLQTTEQYPNFARPLRGEWWIKWRLHITWISLVVTLTLFFVCVLVKEISEPLSRALGTNSNEVGRAWLAGIITVFDLMVVMQDWEFPSFDSPMDIKMLGFNFRVSGKWLNYGIIFMVMLLDLNMLKNQIVYYPQDYGEYLEPARKIRVAVEPMEWFNDPKNIEMLTYEERSTNTDDIQLTQMYIDAPFYAEIWALLPFVLNWVAFGVMAYKLRKISRAEQMVINNQEFRTELLEEAARKGVDWDAVAEIQARPDAQRDQEHAALLHEENADDVDPSAKQHLAGGDDWGRWTPGVVIVLYANALTSALCMLLLFLTQQDTRHEMNKTPFLLGIVASMLGVVAGCVGLAMTWHRQRFFQLAFASASIVMMALWMGAFVSLCINMASASESAEISPDPNDAHRMQEVGGVPSLWIGVVIVEVVAFLCWPVLLWLSIVTHKTRSAREKADRPRENYYAM